MPKLEKKKGLDDLRAKLVRSYGPDAAVFGSIQKQLKALPTGSISLDYELGTGGWPMGHIVTVFGPPDIGKSSMIGLSAVRSAQAMGLNVVWIAMEPIGGDEWKSWARANGVEDPDAVLVIYPTSAEEAFAQLIECAKTPDVGLIVFDSLGAILSQSEIDDEGKPKVGGQAGLITWVCKAINPFLYRHDTLCIMLNQVRDMMGPQAHGSLKMPGGHALEHLSPMIVQLRPGKGRYITKINGNDVMYGREIIAHIKRNKMAMGTGHKAVFDYYFMEAEGHELGIDQFTDLVNTAKRCGVIKQSINENGKLGSMYELPNGRTIRGFEAVKEYLEEQPDVFVIVREAVLEKMIDKEKVDANGGA